MANKSRAYSLKVYQEYLEWFDRLKQSSAGQQELRDRKAYAVFDREHKPLPVEPYPYVMWYLMDANSGCDFEAMEERAKQNRIRNRYKISEALQHVGGDPNAPLLKKEYMENARRWHEANAEGRANDPEWQANDHFTNEANRISESGPKLYESWEKENPKYAEPKVIYNSQSVIKRPSLFKRIWSKLTGGSADLRPPMSYAERVEYERKLNDS